MKTHHPLRPLAAGIRNALLVSALLAATPALADTTPREYHIGQGDLGQALTRFATQAGIVLSFDPTATQGRKTPGLEGVYGVDDGLQVLLSGSGLRVMRNSDDRWFIIPAGEDTGAMELSATHVNSVGLGATTEGTGSYTTGVTSTATKMNLSIRETPQSISVITRQRMDDQHLASITDVLKETPGITMSQDGGERFNIYSRGSAINSYQFDGVNTSQQNETRNMPSTLLDTALYDHIEVVRGATGLMTGAGEPGGVINLIRKKPTREFKAYVKGSVGSWDNYRSEADVSGPLTETGNVRGRMVVAKQDNQTFMDWYDQKREIVYGVAEADLTDTTLVRLGVDYQKYRSTGAPGVPLIYSNGQQTHFSRSTSSGARWMYDDFETLNYTATLEQQLADDWKLRVVSNYMDVDRDADLGWFRSTTGNSFLNQQTGVASAERAMISANQVQKGVDVNLQGSYELFGRSHDLVVGYNYSDYKNHHDSLSGGNTDFNFYTWDNYLARDGYRPSVLLDIKTRQSGYFVANRFNLSDELHWLLGARVSNYSYDYNFTSRITGLNTPRKMRETGEVTPYTGLVYDLTPEQSIYASYTDIFQPQSSQDKNGQVLAPVIGKNYEMGWKGEFYEGRLNASAALFVVERDNFAELDPGQITPSRTSAYRAVDGAKTKGFDLEISGEVAPGWNVQAGYSHARTEDADGKRLNTQLPMDTLRLWTTYRLTGHWDKLTLGGGVNWDSSKSLTFADLDNAKAKDEDYAVASLMARYQVTDHFAATLNVNNLFDEKYYAGMAGSYGHYGAPRNAMLDLRYDF
ncbi:MULTISPECIES: TonB-dependent receptor [unclassified Pseudomonas]|uniref:TonB-dependent siderophore receptor n=1 Tax=Pseudomonas TaxID=286 RepID=UPI000D92BCD7|nr:MULTISPECIES: TonB-dependent receptor [unclassified Pseudomonas]PYG75869.1 outer membrane receptor for ferric coprogen and ferric-rhodotorulic acid [Pseudomonas sp. RV120224-01c]PYG79534.1 outer membrane receptor for ferric coprogen and ferric-rhodotorulic acid [Pseudomonas sp. RV120224-01b]